MADEIARSKALMATMDRTWGPLKAGTSTHRRTVAAPRSTSDAQDRWGQPRSAGDNIRIRRQMTSGRR
jgi:hypothetical protein